LLNLVFPDNCNLCETPLKEFSRIPVCRNCLRKPQPFAAGHFCVHCRAAFANAAPLDSDGSCMLCRLGLTGFDASYSYGDYDGPLRKLIHLFKFSGVYPLANELGPLMTTCLPRDIRPDVIVPMPLHWLRQWKRGFNQSELLARVVGKRVGIPVRNAVRRRKSSAAQAGLTSAERRRNVAGAFEIRNRKLVEGKHVLLIDDVLTTGATAAACARALKSAGAARVTVLTLARADRRTGFARTSVL
jgi:ComF family protein